MVKWRRMGHSSPPALSSILDTYGEIRHVEIQRRVDVSTEQWAFGIQKWSWWGSSIQKWHPCHLAIRLEEYLHLPLPSIPSLPEKSSHPGPLPSSILRLIAVHSTCQPLWPQRTTHDCSMPHQLAPPRRSAAPVPFMRQQRPPRPLCATNHEPRREGRRQKLRGIIVKEGISNVRVTHGPNNLAGADLVDQLERDAAVADNGDPPRPFEALAQL